MFQQPKADIYVMLYSSLVYSSPLNYLLTQIYCKVLQVILAPTKADANTAGLDFSIVANHNGIQVYTGGFNQNILALCKQIISTLQQLSAFSSVDFDNIVTDLKNYFSDTLSDQPYQQSISLKNLIVEKSQFTIADILSSFPQLSLSSFQTFASQFRSSLFIEMFVRY